ncbi:MAG: hypothetical protein AAF411_23370, partial [Myxococcota bacterium]
MERDAEVWQSFLQPTRAQFCDRGSIHGQMGKRRESAKVFESGIGDARVLSDPKDTQTSQVSQRAKGVVAEVIDSQVEEL